MENSDLINLLSDDEFFRLNHLRNIKKYYNKRLLWEPILTLLFGLFCILACFYFSYNDFNICIIWILTISFVLFRIVKISKLENNSLNCYVQYYFKLKRKYKDKLP
jgi:hypothetical protein